MRRGALHGVGRRPRLYVARAELVLGGARTDMLATDVLRPDPLGGFAEVMGDLRLELGERASVAVDLLPLSPAESDSYRKLLIASVRQGADPAVAAAAPLAEPTGGLLDRTRRQRQEATPPGSSRLGGRARAVDLLTQRLDLGDLRTWLTDVGALFRLQVLVRSQSTSRARAHQHLEALVAQFNVFTGDRAFRTHGWTIFGAVFNENLLVWQRRRFDRRMDGGLFAPSRSQIVSAGEIAAFLRPPTRHCQAANVVRRQPSRVSPAPPELPTWTGQPGVLPLGRVTSRDGSERLAGVHRDDTIWSSTSGRANFGKSTNCAGRIVTTSLIPNERGQFEGVLVLSPHDDDIQALKPYLVDVADRVVEINLAGANLQAPQASWNLLEMAGRNPEEVSARQRAIVNAFEIACGFGAHTGRAMAITTAAARSLLELACVLPAELAPTLFQVVTILSRSQWRTLALPYLSADLQDFWQHRFDERPEAVTPVTNLLDRLRSNTQVAALFGASQSSYDARRAMDTGQIVLISPGDVGDETGRLIANLFIQDVLRAGLSRVDIPDVEQRRPFRMWLDELPSYDNEGGLIARLLNELRKFKLRGEFLSQNPRMLSAATWEGLTTNCSHLITTAVNKPAAERIADEWGGTVPADVITQLPRHTYIASVLLGGAPTAPFLFRSVTPTELFGDPAYPDRYHYHPERLDELEAAINRNAARRRPAEVLAELATLDDRIEHWLVDHRPREQATAGGGLPAGGGYPSFPGRHGPTGHLTAQLPARPPADPDRHDSLRTSDHPSTDKEDKAW